MIQILLVEDNPADLRLIREFLHEASPGQYLVHAVSRLSDALAYLAKEKAAVILLDLGLPDSQGLDTFHRLHGAFRDLPVVLLTGYTDSQISNVAVQAGAQDYLNKSDLNPILLERTVRYAIERQQVRLALQSSEQRFRQIIDENSIPIFVLDLEGKILFANPAAANILGQPAEVLLGKDFGFPMVDDKVMEITIRHATGRVIFAELGISETTWEGQSVFLVSLHDITARKEAELALRKTSDQLTGILQSTSDGFFSLSSDLVVTFFNRAAERLLRQPAEQVVGRALMDVFPQFRGTIIEGNLIRVLQNKAEMSFEVYFDRAPYQNWYSIHIYPFEEGLSVYFQITTDKKQAEEDRHWEVRLNAALSELYEPLISPEANLKDISSEVIRCACSLTGSAGGFILSYELAALQIGMMTLVERQGNGEIQEVNQAPDLLRFTDVDGRIMKGWGPFNNPREPRIDNQAANDLPPIVLPSYHLKIQQYLSMPVFLGERLAGQIVLINPGRNYVERDLAGLRRLVEFYSLAVQRWQAENVLRQARDESQRLFQSEREQRELAETLREIVALLVTAPDQKELFNRLLDQVERVVPFDQAVIYLVNGDTAKSVHWSGFDRFNVVEYVSQINFRIADHPNLLQMYESGLPVVIPDTYNWPDWRVYPETAYVRSYAGVPIRSHGQVIGFLNVHSIVPNFFNQTHIERLTIFSDEAAIALENARLIEETRRRVNELELINRISTYLRVAETPEEMLPLFMDELLKATGFTDAGIYMYDLDSGTLDLVVRRGWYEALVQPPLRPGEGVVGHVYETNETHLTPDFAVEPLAYRPSLKQIPKGTGAVSIPLRTAHETTGVMTIAFSAPRQISSDEIHLFETLAEVVGNTFHRMRLHAETQTRLQFLTALRTIDLAIATSFDLRITLNVLLEQAILQLKVDAADILLYNPDSDMLAFQAGRGFYGRGVEQTRLQQSQGYAGQAIRDGRTLFIPDLREANTTFSRSLHIAGERFVAYFAVPLMIKGFPKGVLELFLRSPFQPTSEWSDFLESLSRLAAIAIDNNMLFDDIQRSRMELAMAYDSTLEGWAQAVDLRDRETEDHTRRVVELTEKLARRMGFNENELVHVRRGAWLHDIGKLGVPDAVLNKPGKLDEDEWVLMKKHPQLAYDLISSITYLLPATDIPYCHHERWDGSGYPRGLKGIQIPKAARIFAVVDVFDALSNDRVYNKKWPPENVVEYIKSESGRHFDPEVVDEFMRLLEEEGE